MLGSRAENPVPAQIVYQGGMVGSQLRKAHIPGTEEIVQQLKTRV